jgi:hypothetical protein
VVAIVVAKYESQSPKSKSYFPRNAVFAEMADMTGETK